MKGATTPFPRPRRPPIRLLVRTETMDVQRYLLMGAIAILSFMMLSKWSQFQDEQSLASTTAQHQARQEILQSGDDRKSTRLNSSHVAISYAVFCLKKKKKKNSQN